MAQIGSPPAGWYTDPSGQHRARYWDGAGWTEQVRNDVSGSGNVGADGAPHNAAATVAGVAQALAAVAEQDVVEPAFVVDYGVEPEPTSPAVAAQTPSSARSWIPLAAIRGRAWRN